MQMQMPVGRQLMPVDPLPGAGLSRYQTLFISIHSGTPSYRSRHLPSKTAKTIEETCLRRSLATRGTMDLQETHHFIASCNGVLQVNIAPQKFEAYQAPSTSEARLHFEVR